MRTHVHTQTRAIMCAQARFCKKRTAPIGLLCLNKGKPIHYTQWNAVFLYHVESLQQREREKTATCTSWCFSLRLVWIRFVELCLHSAQYVYMYTCFTSLLMPRNTHTTAKDKNSGKNTNTNTNTQTYACTTTHLLG